MLNAFLRYIKKESLFLPHQPILLAVSGGIDSVVMAELFHQAGFLFGVAHCNFTLRGPESDRDELFVEALAASYKVPFYSKSFPTEQYAREHHLSVQMAAREIRYRWFDELLDSSSFDLVAMAHHLDDQVETMLINLTRGTGLDGLQGIRPKQGRVIRPLLFATRNDIQKYQQDHGLAFCMDSSNLSVKYTRNKIRHEVLPVLNSINPDFRNGLALTIERLKEAGQIVRETIGEKRGMVCSEDPDGLTIHIPRLLKLSTVNPYLSEWLSPMGFNYQTIKRISESLTGISGKMFLTQAWCLLKDREKLIIRPVGSVTPATVNEYYIDADVTCIHYPVPLSFEKVYLSGDFRPDKNPRIAFLDLEMIRFPLILRRWKKGDSFQPFGMKHTKKLSDYFIDQKFSVFDKETSWILESDGKIAWLVGHRPDERFRITANATLTLRIEWLDQPSAGQYNTQ
jgi:tRNA(Ile)-lysidine synthase